MSEPDGLNAVAAFARANGKPMSIAEWGLMPSGAEGGAGDDPTYVKGIASFIENHDFTYNSYFYQPAETRVIPLTDSASGSGRLSAGHRPHNRISLTCVTR